MLDDPKTDKYFFLEDEEIGKYMRKKKKIADEQETFAQKVARLSPEERDEMEATESEHDKYFDRPKVAKVFKRKSHISLKKQVKSMSPEEKEQFLKKAWSKSAEKGKKKGEDDDD